MGNTILKTAIAILAVSLGAVLFFDGYFYLQSTDQGRIHHSTFFSFVFSSAMQKIVAGNLYLNLTFDIVEGNLTIKAEVSTDSHNSSSFLALQFDSDNNGTIDIRYHEIQYQNETIPVYLYDFRRDDLQFLLRVTNRTSPSEDIFWNWLPDGSLDFNHLALSREWLWNPLSPFHRCTFNETKGLYTFSFTFPVSPMEFDMPAGYGWMDGKHGIQGTLVRVAFGVEPPESSTVGKPEKGMTVYVPPFNFVE